MQKGLTNESLGILIRAERVEGVSLCYSEVTKDWALYVSHSDRQLRGDLCTERGHSRRFRTADTALHLLHRLGYQGAIKLDYLTAAEIAAA